MRVTEKKQEVLRRDGFLFLIRFGIGVLILFFLAIIISRLVYPFDNGILEAYNWIPARHVAEGKNPYAASFSPPFSMTPYGIVFYALIGLGEMLFGPQFWWGRTLSIAAFLVCLAAIFAVARRLTGNRASAWAAVLAGLAMFPAQFWIASVRPDLIGAAFAMSALWLALSVEKDEKIGFGRVLGITLLLVAAFFTKQTFLLPAAIVFLRFWQLEKHFAAFFCAFCFAAAVAAGLFLLNDASGGGYWWQHFTHAQRLPHSWTESFAFLSRLLKLSVFFFVAVFLALYLYRRSRALKNPPGEKLAALWRSPRLLIFLYFLISLGWAFAAAGRIGANVNYYLENSLVAAILCGVIFDDFRRDARPLAWAMTALLTLGGAFQMARVLRGEYFRWQSLSYYREVFDVSARLIAPGSACVSVNAELAVWNGCELHFDDFAEYSVGWSPELREVFEREVKAGRYAAIFWLDEHLSERFPNYRLVPMSQSPPLRFYPVYLYVKAAEP